MTVIRYACPHCGVENVFYDYAYGTNMYECKVCGGPVGENFEKLKAIPNEIYFNGCCTGPAYFFEPDDGEENK